MRVTRHTAVQVHPVPDKLTSPKGPFPSDLFREPEIVNNYDTSEFGGDIPLGGTSQNNFKPPRALRCGSCLVRVMENETSTHICEE